MKLTTLRWLPFALPYLRFTCFLVVISAHSLQAATPWKAGSADICITPSQFMWMAGYGHRTHPADGKFTDLRAKSIVLQDGQGQRALLISLDLVGMDRSLAESLSDQLEERFGFQRHQIAICCTHTHTGPVVGRCLAPLHYLQVDQRQRELIDRYAEELQARILACVAEAIERLAPCELTYGSGTADFAVNRRENPEPKIAELRAAGQLAGPVDHDVPVLAVHSLDGQLKALVFGYACHATVLSDSKWSGDYPGFAEQALEARYPGALAVFWAGCGADQNPLPRRTLELARHYGGRLAQAVAEVVDEPMPSVTGPLTTRLTEIDLQLVTPPTKNEWIAHAEAHNRYIHLCRQYQTLRDNFASGQSHPALPAPNRFECARAEMVLERRFDTGDTADTYPYPIGVWQLGEQLTFIFLGGEVVVDYALRLKSELSGIDTWVAAYANDVMAYIPSERVLAEGGYEGASAMVYYGLPTNWEPGVESTIVDAIHNQVQAPTVSAP